MGMQFNVADLQRQLREIESIAKEFLGRGSEGKLSVAADQLEMIACNRFKTWDWQIDSADPLLTAVSKGACERDGKGKHVVGCLSFVWTMQGAGKNLVELVDEGKASTVFCVHEVDDDGTGLAIDCEGGFIQKWNIDVATSADAPGPAFHAQVKNPENLPVPRLPTLLISPADCLDYLLGELFQDRWREHQTGHVRIRSFSKAQQQRFQMMLEEHLAWLNEVGDCSAWTALKDRRPRDALFLSR
jgi:hypothetical protein